MHALKTDLFQIIYKKNSRSFSNSMLFKKMEDMKMKILKIYNLQEQNTVAVMCIYSWEC